MAKTPSVNIHDALADCNKFMADAGLMTRYSYAYNSGEGLHVVEAKDGPCSPRVVSADTLRNSYDAVYRDACFGLAQRAGNLHTALHAAESDPLPSRVVYEVLSDLVDVACDGVDARARDADGLADRINVQNGQHALERGRIILDQYSDAYRGGDLK